MKVAHLCDDSSSIYMVDRLETYTDFMTLVIECKPSEEQTVFAEN